MSQNFGTILTVRPHLNAWKRSDNGGSRIERSKSAAIVGKPEKGPFSVIPH